VTNLSSMVNQTDDSFPTSEKKRKRVGKRGEGKEFPHTLIQRSIGRFDNTIKGRKGKEGKNEKGWDKKRGKGKIDAQVPVVRENVSSRGRAEPNTDGPSACVNHASAVMATPNPRCAAQAEIFLTDDAGGGQARPKGGGEPLGGGPVVIPVGRQSERPILQTA